MDVKAATADLAVPGSAAASRGGTPASPEDVPAVRTEGLTVGYRDVSALDNVDLAVPPGRLVAVVGPNGAGKSTLLKAMLDLVPRQAGTVRFFGRPYGQCRRAIGYVPQRTSVDWDFPTTALQVVRMGTYGQLGWLRRPGRRQTETARRAMAALGVEGLAQRQISQLSGGQQQRVFLARALAQDARLYLMDEPFAGVDATTEEAIVELLSQLRAQGRTVLCVHHDLDSAAQHFDWVVLLNRRLVAQGPTETVFTFENLQATYGGVIGAALRHLGHERSAGGPGRPAGGRRP